MKSRTRILIILIILIVAAILVGARIRTISNGQNKTEAAETRLTLEAMGGQDTAAIQEEIDLKRTLTDSVEGEVTVDAAQSDAAVEEAEPEETTPEEAEPEETEQVEAILQDDTTVEAAGDEVAFSDTTMPSLDELKSLNYKEIFSNCVVMGDSIASGLSSYDILTSSETVTKIGSLTFQATENQLPTAASLNPKVLFAAYGLNDAITFSDEVDEFKQMYVDFLATAKELMPNTKIYALLILPVEERALEKYPDLQHIDVFNQAIIEACEEQGVEYMDLSFTALDSYYDTDGLHMYPDFYYGWVYYMAKGAGLI